MALEEAWLFLKSGGPRIETTPFWNTLTPHERKTPFDFMTSDQLRMLAFYGKDPDQVEWFLGRREALTDGAREALKDLIKDREIEESIMNDGSGYKHSVLEHINARDLGLGEEDGRIADYHPEEKHMVDEHGNHSRDFFDDVPEEDGAFEAQYGPVDIESNMYRDYEGHDPRPGVVPDTLRRDGPREAQVLGSRPWPNIPDDFQAIYRAEIS